MFGLFWIRELHTTLEEEWDNIPQASTDRQLGGVHEQATYCSLGSGGRVVERWTVNRWDGGSIPSTAVSKLRQFCLPHICLCLSEETLKAGGPFYLVSMPGEVKKEEKNRG